jgi:tetratricopeptide (TPR) repeat protein
VQHWKQGTTNGGHKTACRQLALEAYLQLLHEFSRGTGGKPLEDWLHMLGCEAESGRYFPSLEELKLHEFFAARARTCVKHEPKVALPVLLLILSTLVMTTLHEKSPYAADCERRVEDLANALQNAQEVHNYSDIGPIVLKVAVMALRRENREVQAADLLEKHVPLIEASDIIRPVEKVKFLCNAGGQWLYGDRLGRSDVDKTAKRGLMAKRVAKLACQVFQRGTGYSAGSVEEDTTYTLVRSHLHVAECLNFSGEWQESLLYTQKALEFSRLLSLFPPNKSEIDSVYLYECEAQVALAEVLCNLGRVGEAETLLRSGLLSQLDRVTILPYFYKLVKGALLLRGFLVELLMRWLGRHEEAYEQLQQIRREVLPLLTTHAADNETIDDIKMHVISRYWPKASDCLFKLGREDEAYQWDEEALEHASEFLVNTGLDLCLLDYPSIRKVRLELRNWEMRRQVEGERIGKMCWHSRFRFVTAVRCEAARLEGYARAREYMPFYIFHSDRERVAQQLVVSFAKQLLSADVLEEEDYIEEVRRIACVYEADLEEDRRIEEGLHEAVLEQVREEIIAGRQRQEREKETKKKSKKKGGSKSKKKKKGRGRGKGVDGRGEGGAASSVENKNTADEEEESTKDGGEEEGDTAEQQQQEEDDAKTDRECCICFMQMSVYDDEDEEDEQEKTLTLACQHRFHSACVELWTNRCTSKAITPSCPMCRGTL